MRPPHARPKEEPERRQLALELVAGGFGILALFVLLFIVLPIL